MPMHTTGLSSGSVKHMPGQGKGDYTFGVDEEIERYRAREATMKARTAPLTAHICHHHLAPGALWQPLKQVEPASPLYFWRQQLPALLEPFLRTVQVSSIETLKLGI